jgi:hypothetical protein
MSLVSNYLQPPGNIAGKPVLRDYQHAARLYIDNQHAKSPKLGFLYYVVFNLNSSAIIDQRWKGTGGADIVGILVKKIDLPKFNVTTETLNQYNRKTVVQSKLNYTPISIDFHDDNSDITTNLWTNYYRHYYADGNNPNEFGDTKFGEIDNAYGRFNRGISDPFITSVDIYVLHKPNFTHYRIINPKITEWAHDSLNQSDGTKILQNKMTLAYESVIYGSGIINQDEQASEFVNLFYDATLSPYQFSSNPNGEGPYPPLNYGPTSPYVSRGTRQSNNQLLGIAGILSKNYLNKKGLGKLGPVGYNIAGGVLGAVTGSPAGKYASPPSTENQTGIFNGPGGTGINIFKGVNTSVDGKIRANPAAIIFPRR